MRTYGEATRLCLPCFPANGGDLPHAKTAYKGSVKSTKPIVVAGVISVITFGAFAAFKILGSGGKADPKGPPPMTAAEPAPPSAETGTGCRPANCLSNSDFEPQQRRSF
jgi:hypothetical protein